MLTSTHYLHIWNSNLWNVTAFTVEPRTSQCISTVKNLFGAHLIRIRVNMWLSSNFPPGWQRFHFYYSHRFVKNAPAKPCHLMATLILLIIILSYPWSHWFQCGSCCQASDLFRANGEKQLSTVRLEWVQISPRDTNPISSTSTIKIYSLCAVLKLVYCCVWLSFELFWLCLFFVK